MTVFFIFRFIYASSGEDVQYTNWNSPNQPDNFQGNQDCAQFGHGLLDKWDDNVCSAMLPYVCQAEPQPNQGGFLF